MSSNPEESTHQSVATNDNENGQVKIKKSELPSIKSHQKMNNGSVSARPRYVLENAGANYVKQGSFHSMS